jgi:hypothetical protein
MKIKILIAAMALMLSIFPVWPAVSHAEAPYRSYIYNQWKESRPAPNGYLPARTYSGLELGAGNFNGPEDLFVDAKGNIYIADSGNNRIVKLNSRFQLIDVIDKVKWKGEDSPLSNPTGLFVTTDDIMFIADQGNGRVLRINTAKEADQVIENLKNPLIPAGFQFKPSKLAVDEAGRLYVLSEGTFDGLLQFDEKGQFLGYFGSNKVEVTPAVLLETFWKNLLTKSQRAAMTPILPIEYSNLDLGPDGFIYTSTLFTENSKQELKKLNPLGSNVMVSSSSDNDFGDLEIPVQKDVKMDTSFIDLSTDRDGFIAGLDRTRGRVFEYDEDGNPISVFGALGNQKGTFLQPAAIAYSAGGILVLDADKRNITFFKPTAYENLVRRATVLYNQGLYEDAAGIWKKVAKLNINNELAYTGIGKALDKAGQYAESLRYYKLGADRKDYSQNFGQYRIQVVRSHLPLVMSVLIACTLIYYFFKGFQYTYRKRRPKEERP